MLCRFEPTSAQGQSHRYKGHENAPGSNSTTDDTSLRIESGSIATLKELQAIILRVGGESGIRTHGTLSRTHAFQACALSHSATSPHGRTVRERGGL